MMPSEEVEPISLTPMDYPWMRNELDPFVSPANHRSAFSHLRARISYERERLLGNTPPLWKKVPWDNAQALKYSLQTNWAGLITLVVFVEGIFFTMKELGLVGPSYTTLLWLVRFFGYAYGVYNLMWTKKFRNTQVAIDSFPLFLGETIRLSFSGGSSSFSNKELEACIHLIDIKRVAPKGWNPSVRIMKLFARTDITTVTSRWRYKTNFRTDVSGQAVIETVLPADQPGSAFETHAQYRWELHIRDQSLGYHERFLLPIYERASGETLKTSSSGNNIKTNVAAVLNVLDGLTTAPSQIFQDNIPLILERSISRDPNPFASLWVFTLLSLVGVAFAYLTLNYFVERSTFLPPEKFDKIALSIIAAFFIFYIGYVVSKVTLWSRYLRKKSDSSTPKWKKHPLWNKSKVEYRYAKSNMFPLLLGVLATEMIYWMTLTLLFPTYFPEITNELVGNKFVQFVPRVVIYLQAAISYLRGLKKEKVFMLTLPNIPVFPAEMLEAVIFLKGSGMDELEVDATLHFVEEGTDPFNPRKVFFSKWRSSVRRYRFENGKINISCSIPINAKSSDYFSTPIQYWELELRSTDKPEVCLAFFPIPIFNHT